MSADVIEAIVQTTEDEHYQGVRTVIRRSKGHRIGLILAGAIMLAYVTFTLLTGQKLLELWPHVVLLLLFFFVGVPYLQRRSVRKLRQSHPSILSQRYRFDTEGFRITGEMSQVELKWGTIREVYETADFLFIYFMVDNAYFVPKRAFTPEQLAQIRRLAGEKHKVA